MENIKYRNHAIEIDLDEVQESPRDWDNLGTMVCFHRRYNLGDKHNFSNPEEFQDYIKENKDKIFILPLYLYDHSGISISTSREYPFNDIWDSGQVGYIYVEKEKIRKEWNKKLISKKLRDKILNILVLETKVYNQYLSGEIYRFMVKDGEDKIIDSCGGFYEEEEAISEAKDIIDYQVSEIRKKHFETVKQWIKNKVPLIYRKPLAI